MLNSIPDFPEQRPEENMYQDTVEEIFSENIFRLFRKYCAQKGISSMADLAEFDFTELYDVPGLGEGKIKQIKSCWENYFNRDSSYASKTEEPQTINELFKETKFNLFRRYCAKKGINYVNELLSFNFDDLYEVKGFGERKITSIKERWNTFIEKNTDYQQLDDERNQVNEATVEFPIHISNHGLSVGYLNAVGVNKRIIEWLKDNGFNKLEDLQELKWNELRKAQSIGQRKINLFKEKIKMLSEPIDFDVLFRESWNKLKERDCMSILIKRANGHTLQELGEIKGVSRERIRQIERKAINILKPLIRVFADYIVSKLDNKEILTFNDMEVLFGNQEDAVLLKYVLINNVTKRLVYFEELDVVLVDKDLDKIKESLQEITEHHLPDILAFNQSIDIIEELLERFELQFIDVEMFKTYLINIGYRQYKNYLCKGKMPFSKLYSFIIREHFPEGISVYNPEEIQKVRNIMERDFGHSDLPSDRGISGRISAVTVLCDKGKYTVPENISIPVDLLEEIRTFINESPNDTLIIADVFHEFKEKLAQCSNVNNRYFLHGVLRYYYDEEFTFTRDTISKQKGEVQSSHAILEQFLKQSGRPVSKQEIRKSFPCFTDAMLNNAVMFNSSIICWDTHYFSHVDNLSITEDDKSYLKTVLEEMFAVYDGYANAYILYRQLRTKMRDFLLINQINNPINLFYVVEFLFDGDFYFSRPHILLNKPKRRFTTTDLLQKYIEGKEVVSFSELTRYMSRLQLSEAAVYGAVADLQNVIIQLSQDEFVLKSNFTISDKDLDLIGKQLNKHLEDKGYLILNTIDDFYMFPLLEYDWTPHLLESLIKHYMKQFKLIERDTTDRRYVRTIVVRHDFPADSYVDLVKQILKSDHPSGEFSSVNNMEEWLRQKGLIAKVVPKELLDCGAINIGDDGKVYVRY